jgi:hypothetical protein
MLFLRQSYASDAGQARNRFVASRRHAASVRRFRTVLARVNRIASRVYGRSRCAVGHLGARGADDAPFRARVRSVVGGVFF